MVDDMRERCSDTYMRAVLRCHRGLSRRGLGEPLNLLFGQTGVLEWMELRRLEHNLWGRVPRRVAHLHRALVCLLYQLPRRELVHRYQLLCRRIRWILVGMVGLVWLVRDTDGHQHALSHLQHPMWWHGLPG